MATHKCVICGKDRNQGMYWNGITGESYCYLHWHLEPKNQSVQTKIDIWFEEVSG